MVDEYIIKMHFSVILPTFNSADFVNKALDSLLKQKYKKFEVIASDDGSEDDTVKILKYYSNLFKKKKVNFLIIKNSHLGPGHTRNKAILKSQYDWLAFLDSDDVWHEDKLLKVFNKINKNKKNNCILHNEIKINANNKKIYLNYTDMFNEKKKIFKQLFSKNFLSPTSTCIKKSIVKKHGMFDVKLPNAQDYDLWLKIGDELKIMKIKSYLAYYYERKDNISSKPYLLRLKNILKIINRYNKKVSAITYYYKVVKLFISIEWFKNLSDKIYFKKLY